MRGYFNLFLVVLSFVVVITGCAAVGVPLTFDPEKKLKYAEILFNDQGRSLPAEPLIFEAIGTYKKNNDEVGLAKAYQTYAYFLQSPSLIQEENNYRKYGFEDQTVAFDNRYEKAVEYWGRAIELYDKNQVYNLSADCYFQLEKLYYLAFKDVNKACYYNEKSKESILKFRKDNPNVKLDALGFESFEKFIDQARKELGCNN